MTVGITEFDRGDAARRFRQRFRAVAADRGRARRQRAPPRGMRVIGDEREMLKDNVGGICIGCTMPGFPDKFMAFMAAPPGGSISSVASGIYGRVIRNLRRITNATANREPRWRHTGRTLTTGYRPTQYHG